MSSTHDFLPALVAPKAARWRFLLSPSVIIILVLFLGVMAVGAAALVQRHRLAQPAERVRRGVEAVDKKNWREVEAIASRLEIDGLDDEAEYLRARMHAARSNYPGALDTVQRVRDQSSVAVPARLLEGRLLTDLKEWGRARLAFGRVVALDPDNAEAHWGLAVLSFNICAYEDCAGECREAARCDDDEGKPYGLLGLVLKQLKQFHESAEAYRSALTRSLSDHRRAEIRWELAEVCLALDDTAAALDVLKQDSEEDARSYAHQVLNAECLWRNGDKEAALDAYYLALTNLDNPTASPLSPSREVVQYLTHLLESSDSEKALQMLKVLGPRAAGDPDFEAVRLKIYRARKMDAEAQAQEKKVQELEAIQKEIATLEAKAYHDRTDRPSRKRLAELWAKAGHRGLSDQWRDSAVVAVR